MSYVGDTDVVRNLFYYMNSTCNNRCIVFIANDLLQYGLTNADVAL